MKPDFTDRERQVIALVAKGLTNAAIARRLGLSEQRVKNHLTVIFGKAGVRNRVELALSWLKGRSE